MAILTGGQVIAEELGIKLENITLNDLGKAARVRSTRTTRRSSTARQEEGHRGALHRDPQPDRSTTSDYDREKLQERLAKLAGGVAVVKVGAATESEMKEKKARVEDALHATRAAAEEGIVPGGGVALLRAQPRSTASRSRTTSSRRASSIVGAHRGAAAHDLRRTPARKARSSSTRSQRQGRLRVQRRQRGLRRHDQGRRIRTRPRSCARRCRTRPAWPACC